MRGTKREKKSPSVKKGLKKKLERERHDSPLDIRGGVEKSGGKMKIAAPMRSRSARAFSEECQTQRKRESERWGTARGTKNKGTLT